MATTPPAGSGLSIPEDVRAKFPRQVELILGSRSMKDDDRAYWISALPRMTSDQLQSLDEILTTEKKQIDAIERKYTEELTAGERAKAAAAYGAQQEGKRAQRTAKEGKNEQEEKEREEQILKEIEGGDL